MTRLKALLGYQCSNCYAGKIYKKKKPFWFGEINDNCPSCGHKFDKEPGFFFGAMYVSYALTVAECVGTFIICQFFFTSFFDVMMVPILLGVILILSGFNYTLSRVLWIYMFTGKNRSQTMTKKRQVV